MALNVEVFYTEIFAKRSSTLEMLLGRLSLKGLDVRYTSDPGSNSEMIIGTVNYSLHPLLRFEMHFNPSVSRFKWQCPKVLTSLGK